MAHRLMGTHVMLTGRHRHTAQGRTVSLALGQDLLASELCRSKMRGGCCRRRRRDRHHTVRVWHNGGCWEYENEQDGEKTGQKN